MVAAGVYLVGRMMPMLAPEVLIVVACVGAVTALMAGFIALAQNDIKKVLAYSTVSQLGYMFLGLGVGAWHAGLFHLTTHAFFKALMFLGSGSVIHACHHEQDIRRMGGLWKKLPATGTTFLVGVLAIAGFPFLSGFYSKDAILASAWDGFPLLFWIGLAAAILTAFYMTRLFVLTFLGEPRDEHVYEHAHESPSSMTVPLWVLAVLSVIAGWTFLGWHTTLLAPPADVQVAGVATVRAIDQEHSGFVMALAIAAGLLGLGAGWLLFGRMPDRVAALKRPFRALETAFANKFWFDELYREVLLRPAYGLTRWFTLTDQGGVDGLVNAVGRGGSRGGRVSAFFDRVFVDGAVRFVGGLCQVLGAGVSLLQSGRVRAYLGASLGVVALILLAKGLL
jgi:NADH-quinone oxidoreductase subunit L